MTDSISQQLGGLALQHPAGGDAGPGLDDLGDLLGADLLADQRLEVGLLGAVDRPAIFAPARGSGRSGSRLRRFSRPPSRSSFSASIRSWSS